MDCHLSEGDRVQTVVCHFSTTERTVQSLTYCNSEGKADIDISNYRVNTSEYFVQTFDPTHIPIVYKYKGVTYMVYKWKGAYNGMILSRSHLEMLHSRIRSVVNVRRIAPV
jgi:hypothetical protein